MHRERRAARPRDERSPRASRPGLEGELLTRVLNTVRGIARRYSSLPKSRVARRARGSRYTDSLSQARAGLVWPDEPCELILALLELRQPTLCSVLRVDGVAKGAAAAGHPAHAVLGQGPSCLTGPEVLGCRQARLRGGRRARHRLRQARATARGLSRGRARAAPAGRAESRAERTRPAPASLPPRRGDSILGRVRAV